MKKTLLFLSLFLFAFFKGYSAPPNAPTLLSATPSGGDVVLIWTDNSGDETSFEVWRSTTQGSGYTSIVTGLASGFPGTETYTDVSVVAYTDYYYIIKAKKDLEESSSNEAALLTVSPPVTDLTATIQPTQPVSIDLNWTDPGSKETGFEVWRATSFGGPYTNLTPTPLAADETS